MHLDDFVFLQQICLQIFHFLILLLLSKILTHGVFSNRQTEWYEQHRVTIAPLLQWLTTHLNTVADKKVYFYAEFVLHPLIYLSYRRCPPAIFLNNPNSLEEIHTVLDKQNA